MSKAEAKRRIASLLDAQDKWAPAPQEVQNQIHELVKIAYPNGIPLPRL